MIVGDAPFLNYSGTDKRSDMRIAKNIDFGNKLQAIFCRIP